MIMVDDIEQYSRRSCSRIHGIGYNKDQEGRENVMDIVRKCYEEVDIPFDERNIDRAHRIGKTYREKDGDKTFKSIIVKFRSWKSRLEFYRARPKGYEKGINKPGQRLFFRVSRSHKTSLPVIR